MYDFETDKNTSLKSYFRTSSMQHKICLVRIEISFEFLDYVFCKYSSSFITACNHYCYLICVSCYVLEML